MYFSENIIHMFASFIHLCPHGADWCPQALRDFLKHVFLKKEEAAFAGSSRGLPSKCLRVSHTPEAQVWRSQ